MHFSPLLHALFTTNFFPEPICIPEKVFNLNDSDMLLTNQSAVCLACLFNGEGPEPSTVWKLNDQIITLESSIARVNGNGTLFIVIPPRSSGLILTCQHGGSIYNISLNGELYILARSGIIDTLL